MKICQIVAYVSRDGAYGGPTTVAFAQCGALSAENEVTLAAGWDGQAGQPTADGIHRVYRRAYRPLRSFGSLASPALMAWFVRNARSFDIVHIHLGRDLMVMPLAMACRLLGVPYVVQTHGMVRFDGGWVQRLYDVLLTRPVLRGAGRAFTLTQEESLALAAAGFQPALEELRNAVPPQAQQVPASVGSAPGTGLPTPAAETAADSSASGNGRTGGSEEPVEVLFCSRLHQRKRPELFVAAASELHERHPGRFRFRVVGPDGGQLAVVTAAVSGFPPGHFTYDGPVAPEDVPDVFARADVLVLPSIDEPFPMVVLEALAHGLPAVIDETCGLAPIIGGRPGARVVNASAATVADAVESILDSTTDEPRAARELAAAEFSLVRLREQLMAAYGPVAA